MSFDSLLIDPLVVVRSTLSEEEEDLDEMGHPTVTGTSVTPFRGRLEAKGASEMAQLVQAGAGLADFVIRARGVDVTGADYIAHADPDDPTAEDTTDPRRYNVVGIRPIRDSRGPHHLAIDVKLVTGTPGEVPS